MRLDPIYFLTPIIVMAFSFGFVYRLVKRVKVLVFSALAYFIAIILKILVQLFTLSDLESINNLVILGLYYGLQTSMFEVGLAYVFAILGKIKDGWAYGVSLAMWENGVLISIPTLFTYLAYYFFLSILSIPSQLEYPIMQALPVIGLSILERVSSLLLHSAWGYIAVLSVVTRRKRLILVGFPMGFADFLVPFGKYFGTLTFEVTLFGIGLGCLAIALFLEYRYYSTSSKGT
ncbi:symporter [Saccharolobus solfataricus]|uniref:Symporter n=2 Tax=Saccharolobus solfataricus TaxID=2287 RepID=A0A0E3MEE5_SACSO|nr:hypothetical protein [Saccharolobus solfataricus]AKA74584.1 symporter [Saccharolobus solfataricus]AKA77280.1 symporter [Saccharolobus solfataricus]AKA79972.1 symporter [Saccharolobus solfataricus]AZF69054.1 symporter [Saccharolobus solfataricus]AZF71674.1 symporter [Saccharolobus solfataricus]